MKALSELTKFPNDRNVTSDTQHPMMFVSRSIRKKRKAWADDPGSMPLLEGQTWIFSRRVPIPIMLNKHVEQNKRTNKRRYGKHSRLASGVNWQEVQFQREGDWPDR